MPYWHAYCFILILMETEEKMESSLIDIFMRILNRATSNSNQLLYVTLFVTLLGSATTVAANKVVAPGPSAQNFKFIDDEATSNDINCGVDFKESYIDGENQVRTNNREALLSSIDFRMMKSCGIGSEEVQRRLLSNSVVLIDTRPVNLFESYRIPGSLNLSPFEIKSKGFLKSKHLVIVDDSANLMEMGLLCYELKRQGFKKINFINGGIGSWEQKLVGRDVHSIDSWVFGKISPRKFVSLKSKMKWLVLDISNDVSDKSFKFINDDLKVTRFEMEDANSLAEVKKHMTSFSNKSMHGFLVVSKNGERYSEVERYLKENSIKNIYYLDGGMEAYAKYMVEREVFLARLKRGPVRSKSCSNI